MDEYENTTLTEPEDDSTPARLDELGEGGELPEEAAAEPATDDQPAPVKYLGDEKVLCYVEEVHPGKWIPVYDVSDGISQNTAPEDRLFSYRETFAEAQNDLNTYAEENGWEIYLEELEDDYGIPDEETAPADEAEPEESTVPTGQRVSLRDFVFDPFICACDEKINRALRTAMDAQEGFAFTAKITFSCQGQGRYTVEHETGYQFDPIKVKSKGGLNEELQVVLGEDGSPIIPADREHQLHFDEVTPGATVTTDASGVVQSITPDGDPEEQQPEPEEANSMEEAVGETPEGDSGQSDSECETLDCAFYDIEAPHNCRFDPAAECFGADYYADEEDVAQAVEEFGCRCPKVLEAYQKIKEGKKADGC